MIGMIYFFNGFWVFFMFYIQRLEVLRKFKVGEVDIFVVMDLVFRGLDILGVKMVSVRQEIYVVDLYMNVVDIDFKIVFII